ncbi:MAG: bacterioferritin [Micavibrio sp. TMED27]|nr:bacterioferritin [Micavibrio sp.]OUT91829.1 MAG: bacterioferritin [Micavibrio sp. TMED27]
MKGDKKVIEYLNLALKKELGAINQYFLHSRMLDDWGVTKLAKHEYNESIEEMKHADDLIQRILFLGGLPNLQEIAKLHIGESVKEILECDLVIEEEGVKNYKEAIAYADSVHDYVTRDLFLTILKDEEGHVDYLETQLELMNQIGEQNYIQLNSESPLDSEGA